MIKSLIEQIYIFSILHVLVIRYLEIIILLVYHLIRIVFKLFQLFSNYFKIREVFSSVAGSHCSINEDAQKILHLKISFINIWIPEFQRNSFPSYAYAFYLFKNIV